MCVCFVPQVPRRVCVHHATVRKVPQDSGGHRQDAEGKHGHPGQTGQEDRQGRGEERRGGQCV